MPGMKIREGDLGQVLAGKDRGKQGRVIQARPQDGRVVVENLNIVKRHTRPRPIKDSSRMGGQQIAPGGVIEKPAPIQISNVMIVCPTCNPATRIGYELREGMAVGTKVTLRGARMYEFLDRLVSIALPRIRDFRGLSPQSFDGRGNYSIGIREQIIFPEIDYDSVDRVRGLDVTITTSAQTDEEALALLRGLGLPFADARREQ